MTGHAETSARFTISIGAWVEGADETIRRWVFIEARSIADSCQIMIRDPEESFYYGAPLLGAPGTRAQAPESRLKDEFFAVGDCNGFSDPAVKSDLRGQELSSAH